MERYNFKLVEKKWQQHWLKNKTFKFCEENKIEMESVSKLMSKPLKEKLKCDAIHLNFMKKTSRALLPL